MMVNEYSSLTKLAWFSNAGWNLKKEENGKENCEEEKESKGREFKALIADKLHFTGYGKYIYVK